jgi:hypothetical protein
MCSRQSVHRASTNVHRGIELVQEPNGVLPAVTDEVAVMAVVMVRQPA